MYEGLRRDPIAKFPASCLTFCRFFFYTASGNVRLSATIAKCQKRSHCQHLWHRQKKAFPAQFVAYNNAKFMKVFSGPLYQSGTLLLNTHLTPFVPLQEKLPRRLGNCGWKNDYKKNIYITEAANSHEATSIVQTCTSSGYFFRSIMQENFIFNLPRETKVFSDADDSRCSNPNKNLL